MGDVADELSSAPAANTKAALTQNMATQRPRAARQEHAEVQHWEMDPNEPVQHFDFKYRDPEALHLERQRAGAQSKATGGGGGTAAKVEGGGAHKSSAGGSAASGGSSLFKVADDGVLELDDSDDDAGAAGGGGGRVGGVARPRGDLSDDEDYVKKEESAASSPAKRARQSTSHDMLDLTSGDVRESKAVTVELYHETGGAVLTKLTPALVEAPPAHNAAAGSAALRDLMQQAEEYYKDALIGTPFHATVTNGVQLLSANGRTLITQWPQVQAALKFGLIVRPHMQ